jgi:molecular chaperone GrpE
MPATFQMIDAVGHSSYSPLKMAGYTVIDRRRVREEGEASEAETGPEVEARKPTYVQELEDQLKRKDDELAMLLERHRRAVQEFEDARARMRREVGQEIERGKEEIVTDLIEVLDNLERAIDSAKTGTDREALLRGVQVVRDQFLRKLENLAVVRSEDLGAPFDPARQEAVTMVPGPAERVGRVVGVIRPTYTIRDKVLRPGIVAVGAPRA